MKNVVYWLAKYTGIFAICRHFSRGDLRILAYHGIWLGRGHFGNHLFMSPDRFSKRLDQLTAWGFPVLSLDEALVRRESNSLPNGAVVITIDDGWYGSYLHMLPALEKHGFPATLYATTYYTEKQRPVFEVLLQFFLSETQLEHVNFSGLGIEELTDVDLSGDRDRLQAQKLICGYANELDSDQRSLLGEEIAAVLGFDYKQISESRLFHLMNIDELSDMSRRGISLELHTHRHRIRLDNKSCLARELQDNRDILEPIMGKPVVHFCYPSGIFREDNWPELAELGVASATTTTTGLVGKKSHRYALPRILDGELVSDLEFEAELTGFSDIIRHTKSAFRKSFNWAK